MTKPLGIVLAYVAVALIYVLVGEHGIATLVPDRETQALLGTFKDILFAAGSALVIGWLLVWRPEPAGAADEQPEVSARRSRALLVAGGAFLLVLCVGVAVIGLAEDARVAAKRQAAAATAAAQAARIKEQLERAASATYALAALVRQGGGQVPEFERIAREMLPLYPGVSALQLAPDGVVRQIVPLAGHEKALGHDLFADRARNKEALLAFQTRRLTLAGPFNLLQGGMGMVARLPVFQDDAPGGTRGFWGFTTAVMRVDEMLAAGAIEDLARAGYRYELWRTHPDSNERQVFSSSSGPPLASPLEVELAVPNGRWTLGIEPVQGWWSGQAIAMELLLALLAASLAAFAAYQGARVPERLRALVAQRTRDIERAHGRLEESETRFRNLSETTSDWIWEVDANGVYTYASPKVRDLLGYAPHEVLGRTPFDLMPPAEAARVGAIFAEIAAARRPFALLENLNRHKDGREVVLETSGIPLVDADGTFRGYRGIDRDVTARKATEAHSRKLSQAIEQSVNGVVIANAAGVIEFVNPKFCQMIGREAGEVVGRELRSIEGGLQRPEEYARMWETLKAGGAWFGEFQRQDPGGAPVWGLLSASGIFDDKGEVTHFVTVVEDITGRKRLESALERFAYHDPLTELPNRRLFRDRVGQAAAAAGREGRSLALLSLDIDRLKNVNDSLGHDAGDALIKAVAVRLREELREEDSVGRLEGDEFAVLVTGMEGAEDAARVAEKLCAALKRPYRIQDQDLYITVSIGISLYPDDAADYDALERNADTALHHAKEHGDGYRFFKPKMNAAVSRFLVLENRLRHALASSQFTLYYQPQADLATGRIGGAEVLVRWRDPELGLMSPGRFIPLAEETGLIVPLSDWVFGEACRQAAAWRDAGSPCRVAVNLSARQFRDKHILATVASALERSGATPDLIELEITESVVMHSRDDVLDTLRELAAAGFRIAVDDFGTGYSSLAYLKHMPVHVLKIDGSFVRDMATSPNDHAIVSAVITLGHDLGMQVLAECVETRQQLDALRAMHCDLIQGYLYSAPLAVEELGTLLRGERLPIPA
jgi:diguanylate cyclase (GGDEF)-like protein/PAS domain S-box-containing protein